MRSESTSALGQPRLTNPTFGARFLVRERGLPAGRDLVAEPGMGLVRERGRDSSRGGASPPARAYGAVSLRLRVPGLHNVRNAAVALAVVHALQADRAAALEALQRFTGVARRFERLGDAGGVTLVDDYAHHPTEVAATLAAARQVFPHRRVVAVFQPHLYSRTALHGEALGRALAAADVVVVAPIYGAREEAMPGVTADLVARGAARAGATTTAVRDRAAVPERVARLVRSGDVVFTLGAGDITLVGRELLEKLGKRETGSGKRT